MRNARIADAYRRSQDVSRYKRRLLSFSVNEVVGFESNLEFNFTSALTAICGKNGVGKSSFLKLIYFALTKTPIDGCSRTTGDFSVTVQDSASILQYGSQDNNQHDSAFYCEPAKECHRILDFLRNTQNVEELLEGLEPVSLLSDKEDRNFIQRTIGKTYQEIEVYEIESALGEDTTFPYFKVSLPSGVTYLNTEMGMGEFICLYVFWLLNFVPENSILLLDEVDSFIAVYSQKSLIDNIVYRSVSRGLSVVMTTHSDVIISRLGLGNALMLSSLSSNKTNFVKPDHELRYIYALGMSPKIKGAFLVEDVCAKFFLEAIVKYTDPNLFDEYEFIVLGCDSNLEKLTKHFQPHKKPSYEMIVVLDADQAEKIKRINDSSYLYATALPSSNNSPPDELLWNVLSANLDAVAEYVRIEIGRLTMVFENHQYSDLHDRLNGLAEDLGIVYESLISHLAILWAENNLPKVKLFLLALTHRKKTVALSKLKALDSAELPVIDVESFRDSRDDDFFLLTFNSENLEFTRK